MLFFSCVQLAVSQSGVPEALNNWNERETIKSAKIKTSTVRIFDYSKDSTELPADTGYKYLYNVYDTSGKITQKIKYHLFDPLTEKQSYAYNPAGSIIKISRYNRSDELIQEIIFSYNKKGMLSRERYIAYYNNPPVSLYFTIRANIADDSLFSELQDDLQIEPRLETYSITVNVLDSEPENQYVAIGDEFAPIAIRFPWSNLTLKHQAGLLNWTESNRVNHFVTKPDVAKVSYKYDLNGRRTEKIVYDTKEDVISKESYYYDAAGNLTNHSVFEEKGKLIVREVFRYDENGRIIENEEFGANDKTAGKIAYAYDSTGNNIAEKSWYKPDGSVESKFNYKYDSKGNLIEKIWQRVATSESHKTSFAYDENNNLLEVTQYGSYNRKEKLTKYTYEFYP